MTILDSGTNVLTSLPDLPRWVEARSLLLSRRGFVLETMDGCRMICGRKDRLVVPISVELSPLLEECAAREVPGASILLQDVMLPAARYHLPAWNAEPVTVYTLPAERAKSWRLPQWPTSPLTLERIEGTADIPPVLRDQLRDAATRTAAWCASLDGEPAAFAHVSHTTETWFAIAVHTIERARQRGLGQAAAEGLIVERMLRGLRPVWSAPKSNASAHALARRLGFEPVDLLWVLTRGA